MKPKKYNWNNYGNLWTDTSSGGSSRASSEDGSNSQLDWSGTVEEVFREDKGKTRLPISRQVDQVGSLTMKQMEKGENIKSVTKWAKK
jgi:hypothetical protein